jgi:DNA-binding CsgD family transcriptional regulator/pimeloyl-ACP methyl ester carboxylesterase
MSTPAKLRQHVRYLNASDGTRRAWAESGTGPLVVKAANWLTHLEYEWVSPVWRHWIQFFSAHSRFVRYDERGCGRSDWQAGPRAVTCIRYALAHPERVDRIILYGGYARGWRRRDSPEEQREYEAMVDLMRVAWGKDNPTFRQVFTSRVIPGGSLEQLQWFNDRCLKTTSGDIAATLQEARSLLDISSELGGLTTPTLMLHARGDAVCPIAEGRLLASAIPDAEFVELDSRNHILLEHEPASQRFCDAVLAFLQPWPLAGDSVFAALSARERQVLAFMADGLSNAGIAERLEISEKTVRNHASNVFDKLGVWSRAQAIVFTRERAYIG